MVSELIVQIISVVIVLGMLALMIVSKKVHYFVGGLILIGTGVMSILFITGVTEMDFDKIPIVSFAVYFMIVFASKDLLKEGFKEKESSLKWPSIILALLLLTLTTIPTLNKAHVIDWALPEYPKIIDAILYIISGVVLPIGTFTLLSTED